MIKQGNLRAEKVQFDDGIGCCVWEPFPGEPDDTVGLCWDFSYNDIDDLLQLVTTLKEMPAERIVHEDPDEVKPKQKKNLRYYIQRFTHHIGWKLVSI